MTITLSILCAVLYVLGAININDELAEEAGRDNAAARITVALLWPVFVGYDVLERLIRGK